MGIIGNIYKTFKLSSSLNIVKNLSTMKSSTRVTENSMVSSIPPTISNNPREKIEAEFTTHDILKHVQRRPASKEDVKSLAYNLVPRYPLSIVWSPSVLCFEINDAPNLQKVRVWNVCSRSIYILCCGLWGDIAFIGAKWRCFPRIRFLLAPGLSAEVFIQATPTGQSTVPSTQIAIQLAVGHKMDTVVGYFVIPIVVKFHKYVQPCLGEAETSNNNMIKQEGINNIKVKNIS